MVRHRDGIDAFDQPIENIPRRARTGRAGIRVRLLPTHCIGRNDPIVSGATLVTERETRIKSDAQGFLAGSHRMGQKILEAGFDIGLHPVHLAFGKHEQTRIVAVIHVRGPKNGLGAIDNGLTCRASELRTICHRCIRNVIRTSATAAPPRVLQKQIMPHLVGEGASHVVRGTDGVASARYASKVCGITRHTVSIAIATVRRIAQGSPSNGAHPKIQVARPIGILVILVVVDLVHGHSVRSIRESVTGWMIEGGQTKTNARFFVVNAGPNIRLQIIPCGDIRICRIEIFVQGLHLRERHLDCAIKRHPCILKVNSDRNYKRRITLVAVSIGDNFIDCFDFLCMQFGKSRQSHHERMDRVCSTTALGLEV